MRGNGLGFNWKKGIKLNKTNSDTWRTIVTYESTADGFRCQNCADNSIFNGDHFEYRIFVDDKRDMVGGNLRVRLPVSKSSSYFQEVPEFFAYPWFFSKKGKGDVVTIASPQLGRDFDIVLHKPPSFDENPFKSYPTMIVLDLSAETYNMSTHLIDTPIVELGATGEYVIVGFGDFQSAEDRLDLLTQVSGPWYVCINGTAANRCDDCHPEMVNTTQYLWYMEHKCGRIVQLGGRGNDTLDFLTATVLPKVRQLTNMRMRIGQRNLGIMGYSLGGLLACHAAWTRPATFGSAACQSPSFWWPAINRTHLAFFFTEETLADEILRRNRPRQKIYLDAGGQETDWPHAMPQTMIAVAESMAATGAFIWDENLWAFIFPDDPHSLMHWAMRIWSPLQLLLPTNPAPRLVQDEGASKCERDGTSGSEQIHFSNIFTVSCLVAMLFVHLRF